MADEQDNNPQSTPAAAASSDASQQAEGAQFALQRIYLKDSSFESPRSPAVFQSQWQPKVNFDLKTRSSKVQDNTYEVILVLTAESVLDDQPAFLVEVHQAGVFTCKDFSDQQLEQILATVCPNILFPYAREAIDSLVTKGSFPALMLAPINFEALFAQQKQAQMEQSGQADAGAAAGNGNGAGDDETAAGETTQ